MVKLIEGFPSRLANSKHPEGVPLKVTVIPNTPINSRQPIMAKTARLHMRAFNWYLFVTSLRLSKPQSAALTTKTLFPENYSNSSKYV